MTLVVDASVVVAALVDGGRDGEWAAAVIGSEELAAPHLMPVEAANNVTTCDGAYVALAELLDAPLATLDRPLASAPGPRCRFTTPG